MKLRYIHHYRDRHGKRRWYFRRGTVKVALPSPDAPNFLDIYRDAVRQFAEGTQAVGAKRTKPGSIDALAVAYYHSPAYLSLRDSTKATYRGEIERLRAEHGDKPFGLIQRQHISKLIAAKLERGGVEAANNRLRVLRLLMRHAVELGWRADDATLGVKKVRNPSGGFHTWAESEIEAFERRWPIGTRERLAFGLLLYTGQRRADVVRMGRQHVRDNVIEVVQEKTGKALFIPLQPSLAAILAAAPTDNMTFLVTAYGRPFTPAGFGGWFRTACDAAGLKHCAAHGLRKACARRLAEAGCTANQIASITGHDSLAEVQRYTKAAEQKHMARAAIDALGGTESEQLLANLAQGSQKPIAKSLKIRGRK